MNRTHILIFLLSIFHQTSLQAFNPIEAFKKLFGLPRASAELSHTQHHHLQTGNYYFWLGKYNKAAEHYLKLQNLGYPQAYRLLSTVYCKQEHYDKAIACLKKEAKKSPDPAIYRELANIYFTLGDDETGIAYLQKGAALNHELSLRDLTIIYLYKKEYALAELYGEKAAELGNLETLPTIACFYFNEKHYSSAEKFFAAASKKDIMALFYLGFIYAYIYNDDSKAVKIFTEGLDKGNILCALELGNIYFSKKDYALAEQFFNQFLSYSAEHPLITDLFSKPVLKLTTETFSTYQLTAQTMLGLVYKDQGRTEQALSYFLITAEKNDVLGQCFAGLMYLEQNDIKNGLHYLHQCAQQNFDLGQFFLGNYYFKNNDLPQAKMFLEQCVNSTKDNIGIHASTLLGFIYKEENNINQAIHHFKIAADNNDAYGCFSYALLNEEQGNIEEAQRYYQKAVALGYSQAQEKLNALKYYPAS